MITHEQAVAARVLMRLQSEDWMDLAKSLPPSFWSVDPEDDHHRSLVPSVCEAALAQYDAHYITVERAEFQRLQNLERKIEAFFGMMDVRNLDEGAAIDIRRQVDGKWYDVYVERGTSHWLAVKDFGLQFEVSKHEALGDAMRKAFELFELFELFEVPKEAEG